MDQRVNYKLFESHSSVIPLCASHTHEVFSMGHLSVLNELYLKTSLRENLIEHKPMLKLILLKSIYVIVPALQALSKCIVKDCNILSLHEDFDYILDINKSDKFSALKEGWFGQMEYTVVSIICLFISSQILQLCWRIHNQTISYKKTLGKTV